MPPALIPCAASHLSILESLAPGWLALALVVLQVLLKQEGSEVGEAAAFCQRSPGQCFDNGGRHGDGDACAAAPVQLIHCGLLPICYQW